MLLLKHFHKLVFSNESFPFISHRKHLPQNCPTLHLSWCPESVMTAQVTKWYCANSIIFNISRPTLVSHIRSKFAILVLNIAPALECLCIVYITSISERTNSSFNCQYFQWKYVRLLKSDLIIGPKCNKYLFST